MISLYTSLKKGRFFRVQVGVVVTGLLAAGLGHFAPHHDELPLYLARSLLKQPTGGEFRVHRASIGYIDLL